MITRPHQSAHITPARVMAATGLAAVVAFCLVQDRVVSAGVRRYVELRLAANEGRGPVMGVDEVMRPWKRRSVRDGLAWSAAVLTSGGACAAALARRARRG